MNNDKIKNKINRYNKFTTIFITLSKSLLTKKLTVATFILFSCLASNLIFAQTLPSGLHEIELPYKYFFRKSDFTYLYQIKLVEQSKIEVSKINEDFLLLIEKKEYKQAEKLLIQNYSHPFYLLNVILLYIYLDQSEYKPLFITWQEATDEHTIENLIDIFYARRLNTALEKLSKDFLSPELKRYALYKVYKEKKQPDLVLKNFSQWKSEVDKEQNSKLYEKAYADWLFSSKIMFVQDPIQSKVSAPSQENISIFEDDLIHEKYTRDMLSKYIQYLIDQKKWDKIKPLLDKIGWLTEEEKNIILQKANELEKKYQPKKSNNDYIKVKINK